MDHLHFGGWVKLYNYTYMHYIDNKMYICLFVVFFDVLL